MGRWDSGRVQAQTKKNGPLRLKKFKPKDFEVEVGITKFKGFQGKLGRIDIHSPAWKGVLEIYLNFNFKLENPMIISLILIPNLVLSI